MQIRLIIVLEGLVMEGKSIIESAESAEGIGALRSAKAEQTFKKLDAKLEARDFVSQLQANNTRTSEDGSLEDLAQRGYEALQSAIATKERLSLLTQLLRGLDAREESDLEYSPIYMLRAISDAQIAGLRVPPSAVVEAVRRSTRTALRDSPGTSMASFDPDVDMSCGLCLLRDSPMLEGAQSTIAVDVLNYYFDETAVGLENNAEILHTLNCMIRCARSESLKELLQKLRLVFNASTENDKDVASAIDFVSAYDDERMQKLFGIGPGRRFLNDAKIMCTQRAIEQGAFPSQCIHSHRHPHISSNRSSSRRSSRNRSNSIRRGRGCSGCRSNGCGICSGRSNCRGGVCRSRVAVVLFA